MLVSLLGQDVDDEFTTSLCSYNELLEVSEDKDEDVWVLVYDDESCDV